MNIKNSNYWKSRFKDLKLEKYFDPTYAKTIAPDAKDFSVVTIEAKDGILDKLNTLASSIKAKHLTLLSVLGVLAHKYSCLNDICIFTPVYKTDTGKPGNVIPFRINSFAQETFKTILSSSKENWIKDVNNCQISPLDIFGINEPEIQKIPKIGFLVNGIQQDMFTNQFVPDISFDITISQSLVLDVKYDSTRYDERMVKQIALHYFNLLDSLISNVDTPIHKVEFISSEERERILFDFNDTNVPFPENKTVVDIFEEMVVKSPNNTAIKFQNKEISYKELNQLVNQKANYIKEFGVDEEDLIPILMERSDSFLIHILAIWKLGAAYIPFETDYPTERIKHIVEVSNAKSIIVDNEILEGNNKTFLENLDVDLINAEANTEKYDDQNLDVKVQPDNMSYVIFTSGSTGNPKGVMIEHKGMLNHLFAKVNTLQLTSESCVAQNASQCFDISVWQFFSALLVGGKTAIYSKNLVLDPIHFLNEVKKDKVSILEVVPSYLSLLLDYERKGKIPSNIYENISYLLVTGETLPTSTANAWYSAHPSIPMVNAYGPTEASDDITHYTVDRIHDAPIPIGRTLQNLKIYILDSENQLCGIGMKGELCVSGVGVGRGYLKDPERTNKSFVEDPFRPGIKMYRTGDLAKFRYDGVVEFFGRTDHQIKINGYRIELGEIESQLSHYPNIKDVVVVVKSVNKKEHLACYYTSDLVLDEMDLSNFLTEKLPDYMVPKFYIKMEEVPLTPNGKFDRKALPEPMLTENENNILPQDEIDKELAIIWSDILKVNIKTLGVHSNFFKLGGDSLKVIQLNTDLKEKFNIDIPVAELFRQTTIDSQSKYISRSIQQGENRSFERETLKKENVVIESNKLNLNDQYGMGIAVIGMAARFPGATTISEFWENISNGTSAIQKLTEEEMIREGVAEKQFRDPSYVNSNAYLDDKEFFDASFFGYRPDEAKVMDPQVRVFHEICWHALEDAGIIIGNNQEKIGLFAGATTNQNWQNYVGIESFKNPLMDDYSAFLLMNNNYMCSRVSYLLDLKGPSVFVNTACSTSLVAIQRACMSILTGESTVALAGGVTINNYSKQGYLYKEGMIKSEDGVCRPFDKDANGTVMGEGAGMVVLKPLKEAQKDGDQIYAVIRGASVNNDGNDKSSYTAPSIDGQNEVIQNALNMAGVTPSSIGYVETHGTGTKLGDPIEIQALKMAYGNSEQPHCALGAIKSIIGHTDTAAGVAGFMKTVLALKNKKIPPMANFKSLNPNINFDDTPFYINKELLDWDGKGQPLRAGVSSFGIGGTNAHIVIEEAPLIPSKKSGRSPQLLTFSAKTNSSLRNNISSFLEMLKTDDELEFENMVYTLNSGRKGMGFRKSFACETSDEAITSLSNFKGYNHITDQSNPKDIVFMFSGQGSQYFNMCLDLYKEELLFKKHIDECLNYVEEHHDLNLKPILFPQNKKEIKEDKIQQTEYTQPALFIIEYALAKLIMSWGFYPDVLIGHSIGEYTAACISGVFDWKDALQIVITRGKLMGGLTKGEMLSVSKSYEDIEPLLTKHENVSLAAVNSTNYCVVSGNEEAIDAFKVDCNALDYRCIDIKTSHAFHSHMMDDILEPFAEKLKHINFERPKIKVISNVTGAEANKEDLISPQYWVKHLRNTVHFSKGLQEILKKDDLIFLEIGPGKTLTTFLNKHKAKNSTHKGINTVRHVKEKINDQLYLLKEIGRLWENGVEPSWKNFYSGEDRRKVSLPGYNFQKTPYPTIVDSGKMITELGNTDVIPFEKWFYKPSWKLASKEIEIDEQKEGCTLILADDQNITDVLIEKYFQDQREVIKVKRGSVFEEESSFSYYINPLDLDDHQKLLNTLKENEISPVRILYLWGISENTDYSKYSDKVNQNYFGFLNFIKTFDNHFGLVNKQITVITNNLLNVIESQKNIPFHAMESSLLKVIPQEYTNVSVGHIDISDKEIHNPEYIDMLYKETLNAEKGKVISLKNNLKWSQMYERIYASNEESRNFKSDATYLITGGLGDLGYCMSKYLIEKYNASLILTGKTILPERETWDQHLQEGKDSRMIKRIERLKYLESINENVIYDAIDVSDRVKMEKFVHTCERKIGKVNGVIHAAGIIAQDSGVISIGELKESDLKPQLKSKIEGLKALSSIFGENSLDFCLVTSSLSSILGGMGYGAYVTANQCMDYFLSAYKDDNSKNNNWISINLDGLSLDGMVEEEINAKEITEVFEKILNYKSFPQIIVSKRDLEERLNRWVYFREERRPKNDLSDRVLAMDESFIEEMPDINEVERKLLLLWIEFFGNPDININSDFFEIGGDSLKALSLVGRINREFSETITISDFFQNSTIEELANVLNPDANSRNIEDNNLLEAKNQDFVF